MILPKRCMGDIDGASCTVANVSAYVVKDGEALFLPYEIWHREITANTKILDIFTAHVVKKQESHIEALLACFTMEVDMRLVSLFQALIKAYYPIKPDGWNPLPVQLNTVMLSKIISSSRTSVSLQLSEWANRGLVKKDGKFLLIHGALCSDLFDWWENRKTDAENLRGRIISSLNKQIPNKE